MLENLPDAMRAELERALKMGANYPQPVQAFHDAPLHPQALSQLMMTSDDISLHRTFTSVGKDMSETSLQFTNHANNESHVLTVQVHDNYAGPLNALIHHLTGYECSLTEIISSTHTPLGRTSLRSPTSIFWIRGNLFVTLRHLTPKPSEDSSNHLHSLASRVDSHLQSGAVQPPFHHQADTRLNDPAPETVQAGELFTIRLASNERNFAEMHAQSSDATVIATEGQATEEGVFEFMALKAGMATISLFVAHKITLHPRYRVMRIEVLP